MILAITYGDEGYKRAKKFNMRMAKKFGADRTVAFGPEDIDDDFKTRNEAIWKAKRGGGYWIWKPYVISKALDMISEGDYLVYTDAGSIFTASIKNLIKAMNVAKTDVMSFCITYPEKMFTKRDVFVALECEDEKYAESLQRCGTYVVLKKTKQSQLLIDEYLRLVQLDQLVTDHENILGKENYEGFVENRHDQSIWSVLTKKYGYEAFRDPSQFGEDSSKFPTDVLERSKYYTTLIYSFRDGRVGNHFQLKYGKCSWYKLFTLTFYKSLVKRVLR